MWEHSTAFHLRPYSTLHLFLIQSDLYCWVNSFIQLLFLPVQPCVIGEECITESLKYVCHFFLTSISSLVPQILLFFAFSLTPETNKTRLKWSVQFLVNLQLFCDCLFLQTVMISLFPVFLFSIPFELLTILVVLYSFGAMVYVLVTFSHTAKCAEPIFPDPSGWVLTMLYNKNGSICSPETHWKEVSPCFHNSLTVAKRHSSSQTVKK